MERTYRVNGLSKKGGYQKWAMDVTANNQKEAVKKATDHWYGWKPNTHLFDIRAKRLSDYDESLYNFWARVDTYYENKHGK